MDAGIAWLSRVPPPLVGCWFLGRHWEPGTGHRTEIGRIVYRAKTYGDKRGEIDAANQLGELMARSSGVAMKNSRFPLEEVNLVLAVPSFPEKQPFNLPDVLAGHIAVALRADCPPEVLVKTRETPQAKFASAEEILTAASAAYDVRGDVRGSVVLIVDDLVQSGATLAAIATHLIGRGALTVGGFAATRAAGGMVKTGVAKT